MSSNFAVGAAIRALRTFVAERPREASCALCGARIAAHPAHPHLLSAHGGRVVCACGACSLLFGSEPGAAYRRLPRTVELYGEPVLSDADWRLLGVPIRLACFVRRATEEIECIYPSPAGPVRSALDSESTAVLTRHYPAARELLIDVEAIILCAVGERRAAFRVPVDECFRLVGLTRRNFRGASGGAPWWSALEGWVSELVQRSAGESHV
jgi:hypothetical protein